MSEPRRPKTCRSSGSTIAAEVFMSQVGWGQVADGRQGRAQSSNGPISLSPQDFVSATSIGSSGSRPTRSKPLDGVFTGGISNQI